MDEQEPKIDNPLHCRANIQVEIRLLEPAPVPVYWKHPMIEADSTNLTSPERHGWLLFFQGTFHRQTPLESCHDFAFC